ncbi:hypothetical protein [Streptomyces sp. NPDC059262]|uniref:hypothetical protein n=1 Tax=Streptomyces sp. NPDC059262 TaxID=3346797 RepID=UPI0036B0484D
MRRPPNVLVGRASDSWSPIADLPTDLWGSAYTSANGLLLTSGGVVDGDSAITNQGLALDPVAGTWSALPNASTALYRAGGAPGFYSVGGGARPGRDRRGAGREQATLAPGASTTVVVTLDASAAEITQPGAYTAKLGVRSDTPKSTPDARSAAVASRVSVGTGPQCSLPPSGWLTDSVPPPADTSAVWLDRGMKVTQ